MTILNTIKTIIQKSTSTAFYKTVLIRKGKNGYVSKYRPFTQVVKNAVLVTINGNRVTFKEDDFAGLDHRQIKRKINKLIAAC